MTVRSEILDGGVLVVTIDRPQVRNAVDGRVGSSDGSVPSDLPPLGPTDAGY